MNEQGEGGHLPFAAVDFAAALDDDDEEEEVIVAWYKGWSVCPLEVVIDEYGLVYIMWDRVIVDRRGLTH